MLVIWNLLLCPFEYTEHTVQFDEKRFDKCTALLLFFNSNYLIQSVPFKRGVYSKFDSCDIGRYRTSRCWRHFYSLKRSKICQAWLFPLFIFHQKKKIAMVAASNAPDFSSNIFQSLLCHFSILMLISIFTFESLTCTTSWVDIRAWMWNHIFFHAHINCSCSFWQMKTWKKQCLVFV